MIRGSNSSCPSCPGRAGKTRRRSRGAAATPLLGSGFNYPPAKLEQDFMLGKSLSNLEDLIRMENAPERGVWNHRLRPPSADLREKRAARARRGGEVPDCSGKGGSSNSGNAEGNERERKRLRAVLAGWGWWEGRGAAGAWGAGSYLEDIALVLWYFHVLLEEFALAVLQKSQQQFNKKNANKVTSPLQDCRMP